MKNKREEGFFSKKNMLGLFIVLIMVFSGIGYMAVNDNSANSLDYHGFRFTSPAYNVWYATIGERQVQFAYHPTELEHIQVSPEVAARMENIAMAGIIFSLNIGFISTRMNPVKR